MRKNNKLVVMKGNEIVQEAIFSLNKVEFKALNYIISKLPHPKYNESLPSITFEIAEFKSMLGGSELSKNDMYYKKALKNLATPVAWILQEDEKGVYETTFSWIEAPKIYKGKGVVEIQLAKQLTPYLTQLKRYTSYELENIMSFQCDYSIRLYELMKSWEKLKNKEFELDYFKLLIDADRKSYENFSNFRKWALDPAVNEINNYTDILLSYTLKRKGKKVTGITFSISKKSDAIQAIPSSEEEVEKYEKESLFSTVSPEEEKIEEYEETVKINSNEWWENIGDKLPKEKQDLVVKYSRCFDDEASLDRIAYLVELAWDITRTSKVHEMAAKEGVNLLELPFDEYGLWMDSARAEYLREIYLYAKANVDDPKKIWNYMASVIKNQTEQLFEE